MRCVRSGCGAWCLLNVERYGVEEDGDEDESEDEAEDEVENDAEKKIQTPLAICCVCV